MMETVPTQVGMGFGWILAPGKASHEVLSVPVPQTDTGGHVEKTKTNEKTSLEELGKTTGRNLGRCPATFNYMNVATPKDRGRTV